MKKIDFEQGLRDYLEIKASVSYIENELNRLTAYREATIDIGMNCKPDSDVYFCRKLDSSQSEKLNKKILILTAKLEQKKYMLNKLDALISALDERELFVAKKFYIEHLTWRDVVSYYNMNMPSPREMDALKAVRKRMLEKINRVQMDCYA